MSEGLEEANELPNIDRLDGLSIGDGQLLNARGMRDLVMRSAGRRRARRAMLGTNGLDIADGPVTCGVATHARKAVGHEAIPMVNPVEFVIAKSASPLDYVLIAASPRWRPRSSRRGRGRRAC